MTLRELLTKADELERIASELRAMVYEEGRLTKESTEPPLEGGKLSGDNNAEAGPIVRNRASAEDR
jgi:hypothetical protein